MKAKQCKIDGCNNPSWSGGLCNNHIKKTKIPKKSVSLVSKLRPYSDKMEKVRRRYAVFAQIWKKRPHKSEVSGEKLYGEMSSAWFHHIIPKRNYPLGDLDEENIILLTMDEHADVESDMYKFEEVNKRREQLLIKYNLN